MEQGKRKWEEKSGANAKSGKARKNDDTVKGTAVPPDEEVEEFFAILKRIHVAVKYFQERKGGGCVGRELTTAPWSLTFEREDFDGVKKAFEGNKSKRLDLNSDPVSDISDHGD